MVTETQIKKVAKKIAKEYDPEKIILFGSYAWGKPHKDSDIDLFIVKKTDNNRDLARKINRLIFPRLFPMDILIYTPEQVEKRQKMQDFFIRDILTKGKILYAKE